MQAVNRNLTKLIGRWDRWPHFTVQRGSMSENGQLATGGSIVGEEEKSLKFNVRKTWLQLKEHRRRVPSSCQWRVPSSRPVVCHRRVPSSRTVARFGTQICRRIKLISDRWLDNCTSWHCISWRGLAKTAMSKKKSKHQQDHYHPHYTVLTAGKDCR